MTIVPAGSDHPSGDQIGPAASGRSRLLGLWLLLATLLTTLAIDQISKELALHALTSGPRTVAGVQLRLVANRGILMGIPAPTILIVLATAAVVFLAVRSTRGSRWWVAVAYGMLAGGALGNLVDRFQDRHFFPSEAVVDWISTGRITFNLADVFLISGVALLFLVPGAKSPTDDEAPLADALQL